MNKTEKLKEYEVMSRDDLLVVAKESGINVPGNISKEKLIEKLMFVFENAPAETSSNILEELEKQEVVEEEEEVKTEEKEVEKAEGDSKQMYTKEEVDELIKSVVATTISSMKDELREEIKKDLLPKDLSREEMKAVIQSQIKATEEMLSKAKMIDMFLPLEGREKRLPAAYIEVGLNGVLRRYRKGVSISVPEPMANLIKMNLELKDRVGDEWKVDRSFTPTKEHPYPVMEVLS